MKNFIKYLLQKLFGYHRYLFLFAKFKTLFFKTDKKEKGFFHFIKLIPSQGIILDIGANIGLTAYHLAKSKPNCNIHAFEPIESNYTILKKHCNKFKNISFHLCALGEKEGTVEMVLPIVSNVKMQGLSHVKHSTINDFNEGTEYKVELKTLDSFKFANVVAIKMDVENYEQFVLQGAIETLKKSKPVIYLELWDNENRTHCFSILGEIGYKINILNGCDLELFNPLKHKKQQYFICTAN